MPSLKSLRTRITSVKSTRKITKAMQLVASAKLKRAREAAEAARPYAKRIAAVVANLAANVTGDDAPALLRGTGADKVRLYVVASAERGLCGGFAANISKLARQRIGADLAAGKTVKIITIGKKAREQMRKSYGERVIDHIDLAGAKKVGFDFAKAAANKITDLFAASGFDQCVLIYSEFKNVISQVPTALQIVPATAPQGVEPTDLAGAIYRYEPTEAAILEALLPRYMASQIFQALLENDAGEQGARMTAMDNATKNAGELVNKLTLQMNRTRQAMITRELIEIISGADAV